MMSVPMEMSTNEEAEEQSTSTTSSIASTCNPFRKRYCYETEAAVAMNNMGLILIRKGCTAQACETLQSAAVAIRSCCCCNTDNNNNNSNNKGCSNDDRSNNRSNIYDRVKVAVECALNPMPRYSSTDDVFASATALNCQFVSSHWETSLPSSQTIQQQQFQQQQQQSSFTSSFPQEHPLPCYTFVRIDDDSNDIESSCRNLCHSNQLLSVLILYNFAVASFLHFNTTPPLDLECYNHRVQRKRETLGWLSFALQTLNEHMHDCHNLSSLSSECSSSPFYYSRLLFLKATIYHTLQLIMKALDQPDRAVACLKQLIHVRAMFCLWNDNSNNGYLNNSNNNHEQNNFATAA